MRRPAGAVLAAPPRPGLRVCYAGAPRMTENSQGASARQSPLDVALSYIDRGLSPIPVPHRRKGPVIDDWEGLEITAENAGRYFNGGLQNIGVRTGPPSGDIVDVDLDCGEALALADSYLPRTGAVFGRPSKARSHRLYKASGSGQVTCIKYVDPDTGEMLLELRSDR